MGSVHEMRPYHRRREEVTVQILPQDDRWADNTTAITGATSDRSVSPLPNELVSGQQAAGYWDDVPTPFQRWSGSATAAALSVLAFLSPIVMVVLPKIDALEWRVAECGPECDGLLISFSFKLLILLIGCWAVFWRPPRSFMPRVFVYRWVVMALLSLLLMAYWLFYGTRVTERARLGSVDDELPYQSIVLFASSMVDALLAIQLVAVLLIHIRHMQPQFYVKVVRSPDGASQSYNVGQLSIQRCAVFILEHYYRDFPLYNPHLDLMPSIRQRERARDRMSNGGSAEKRAKGALIGNGHAHPIGSGPGSTILSPAPALKYYDVDGIGTSTPNDLGGSSSLRTAALGSSIVSHGGAGHYASVNSLQRSHAPGSIINMDNQQQHAGNNHQRHQTDLAESLLLEKNTALNAGSGTRSGRARSTGGRSHRHGHSGSRGSNDRFYDEMDYERRVKKRRARLLTAAEEAFTHIRRVADGEQGPAIPMDPQESAQAIFPSMARALQKYLKVTRQQPYHSIQSILSHLSKCLQFDLSAKAFLEKYLVTKPVMQLDRDRKPIQSWGLICDELLSRTIQPDTVFMLRHENVSLLVTVSALPYINLREEIIDPKSNKFVFHLNSETSV